MPQIIYDDCPCKDIAKEVQNIKDQIQALNAELNNCGRDGPSGQDVLDKLKEKYPCLRKDTSCDWWEITKQLVQFEIEVAAYLAKAMAETMACALPLQAQIIGLVALLLAAQEGLQNCYLLNGCGYPTTVPDDPVTPPGSNGPVGGPGARGLD